MYKTIKITEHRITRSDPESFMSVSKDLDLAQYSDLTDEIFVQDAEGTIVIALVPSDYGVKRIKLYDDVKVSNDPVPLVFTVIKIYKSGWATISDLDINHPNKSRRVLLVDLISDPQCKNQK